MPPYGKGSEYWDERYKANDTTFDWYCSFDALKDVLLPYCTAKPDCKVLVVGCGNSRLSPQLYDSGVHQIINVDISEVVIGQMRARYREMDKMVWARMDVTRLEFPDASFDVVISKGLIDAMLCGSNSFHNVYQMNKQISRVLKRGGKYICVSYASPDTRADHFRRKRLHFDLEHRTVDKPVFSSDVSPTSNYHVYIMTKSEDAADEANNDGNIDGDDEDDEDDDFYDRFSAHVAM